MAPSRIDAVETSDVFVVGAGLTGLTAAIGFARAGRRVVLAGAAERLGHGRTVALLGPSVDFLDELGVWPAVEPRRRADARLEDRRRHRVAVRAARRSNSAPARSAATSSAGMSRTRLSPTRSKPRPPLISTLFAWRHVAAFDFAPERAAVTLADGRVFVATLVVGADGRASPSRRAAGISARVRRYPQSALTVLARPRAPARRRLDRVPHPPGAVHPGAPARGARRAQRSSLVWAMSEAEAKRRAALDDFALAAEIERQARALLGAMRIEGERGVFPLARQSVARRRDPAGAGRRRRARFPADRRAGLNLGLRDVKALIAAATASGDLGADAALDAYARSRAADVLFRTAAVAGLNRSLLAACAPVDLARGLGLAALGAIGPLRRLAMREGVAPLFAG